GCPSLSRLLRQVGNFDLELMPPKSRIALAGCQTCPCIPRSRSDTSAPHTLSGSWSAFRRRPSCKQDLLSYILLVVRLKSRMPESLRGLPLLGKRHFVETLLATSCLQRPKNCTPSRRSRLRLNQNSCRPEPD